jgi:hypothetical protein
MSLAALASPSLVFKCSAVHISLSPILMMFQSKAHDQHTPKVIKPSKQFQKTWAFVDLFENTSKTSTEWFRE